MAPQPGSCTFQRMAQPSKGPRWKLSVYLKTRPVTGTGLLLRYILGQHTYGPARMQRGERNHTLSGRTVHEFVIIFVCHLPHHHYRESWLSGGWAKTQYCALFIFGYNKITFLESKVDEWEPGILSGVFTHVVSGTSYLGGSGAHCVRD